MRQRRIDAQHLRVGLRGNETRESVAGIAADAFALARILLIEHDAERGVKRPQSSAAEVVAQLLDARLVSHRGMRIGTLRSGIGGIFAAISVHVILMLGLAVIGL